MGKGLRRTLESLVCALPLVLGTPPAGQAQESHPAMPIVTLYTAVSDKFEFRDESLDLAAKYLRDEVWVELKVVHCEPGEIPQDLDHRTKLAFVESETYSWFARAWANVSRSMIVVYTDIVIRNLWGQVVEAFRPDDIVIDIAARKRLKKENARTIVHELGHIAGLWHSFQYDNDPVTCTTESGVSNVMSYNIVTDNHEYGFDLTPWQKERMRDYFSGGKAYQELEQVNFDFAQYIKVQEEKNGYTRRKSN